MGKLTTAEKLVQAVDGNQYETVRDILETVDDVNALIYRKGGKHRPLQRAAYGDSVEIAELLLDAGADIEVQGYYRRTPLLTALSHGKPKIAGLLLERGASMTVEDDEGEGVFELSCHSMDTFNLVLKYAHKDHLKAWLDANFSYCAGFVPLDVLHLMLDLGASISDKRSTVLHNATRNPERLRALIELGANINSITTDFDTPLHTACERSERIQSVEILISNGADIFASSERGFPLCVAIEEDNKDAIALLEDVIEKSGPKKCNMFFAAKYGWLEAIDYLIEHGSDVNSRDNRLWTPLHFASSGSQPDAVKKLIKIGAEVNAISSSGNMPLELATSSGIAEILLANGALVDIEADGNSKNPLMRACWSNNEDMVKTLLAFGADTSFVDSGNTPLTISISHGLRNIVSLLLDAGADVNHAPTGHTPLSTGIGFGYENIVSLLLDMGADVNLRDKDGSTPLHDAARKKSSRLVKELISRGADVNAMDDNGRTPLHSLALHSHSNAYMGSTELTESELNELLLKEASIDMLLYIVSEGILEATDSIIASLLDKGAELNLRDGSEKTPFKLAVSIDNIISAMSLKKAGAEFGRGSLEQAVKASRIVNPLELSELLRAAKLHDENQSKADSST